MKKRMNLLALCASVFATLASPVLSAEPESDMIGRRIPDFLLPDAAGKKVTLSDFNDSKTLAVVFLGTQCPIGNAYVPVLGDLQKKYKDQGLQVVAVIVFGMIYSDRDFETISSSIRYGLFQVASIVTTTGYGTSDFDSWNQFSRGLLLFLMFIGGCAGSTGGGMKVIRHILFVKILRLDG